MKPQVLVISFFLLAAGIMVGGLKVLHLPANSGLVKAAEPVNELLTDKYVQENVLNQDGNFKEGENTYIFNNTEFVTPTDTLRSLAYKPAPTLAVLGSSTEKKRIVVDLEDQRVYAYEGNRVVFNFLVSTGLYGRTRTGNFKIWYKVRSQAMKGGDRALGTYYYLPNVQFVQFFDQAISFHSTYWHNNFGHPMSHGCVNMTLTDAETLYYWANPEMPAGVRILRPTRENPGTDVEVVETWEV